MLIAFPFVGFQLTLEENVQASKTIKSEDFPSQEKGVEELIKELTAYLKNNPRDGLAFKQLGELYTRAGRLSEAVSSYIAAAEILPKDPQIRRAFIQLQAMGHTTSNQ